MKFLFTNMAAKSSYLLIGLTILLGCNFSTKYKNRVQDKNDAQKVTNLFYSFLRDEKYNDTYKLLSKNFFKMTDTSNMNNLYRMTFQKLGAITNINLDHWDTQVIEGTNPSSDYTLYFLVTRQKYASKENISLSKENDTIKIVAYRINSDGFYAADSLK